MNFTFGICTYNSEKYIVQALESVKYQVITYGKKISVSLIISDDCSSDETVKIIQYWLKLNRDLFKCCILLQQEKNCGIAYNYANLLDNIHTEYFKTIDGDDVISSINIFEQINNVRSGELKIFFPIRFNDKNTYVEESDYINMYYNYHMKHKHEYDLYMLETIKPFITPEVCFLRDEYSDETGNFVRNFTQFEDDTSLYYIFKNNNKMIMNFELEPMILYRVHNKSLSNGEESIANIKFLDDLHKFKKYLFKEEKRPLVKLIISFIMFDTFRMKHRFSIDISMSKMITNYYAKKTKKYVETHKDFFEYKNRMQKMMEKETEHLKYIEQSTYEYLIKYDRYKFGS